MSPTLLNFGSCIEQGKYQCHSCFDKAINFVSGDRLISVVKEEIGAGPINIVVSGLDFFRVKSLRVNEESIVIGEQNFLIEEHKKYDPKLSLNEIDVKRFRESLDFFERFLIRLSPSKSLAFLLSEEREGNFKPGFEKEVAYRIKAGVKKIFTGELENGVRMLKGTGFGLTPGGDDFIAGLLFGLNITQLIAGIDLSTIREKIYKSALGKNIISNAFLYQAKEGLFFERFKSLLFSLFFAGKKEIKEDVKRLLSVGATSGADIGVGFLMAMRWFGKDSE